MQNLYFPQIAKIEISNFSLYTTEKVEIEFGKSATCLMGANGIGKSTLLNCITYALTGYINDPRKKKVKSVDDFVGNNNYYKEYFAGRISAKDKEHASVRITFILNDKRFCVKRMFYPSNNVIEFYLDGVEMKHYEESVVAFSNLKSFNQFVFIVIKLLTFDEARDCIFWNEFVLTPIMFLCMGADSETAEKADILSREIQRVSSLIRNAQWEISKQNNRLNTLIEEKKNVATPRVDIKTEEEILKFEELKKRYEKVCEAITINEEKIEAHSRSNNSAESKLAELSITKLNLEEEYERQYYDVFNQKDVIQHGIIARIQEEGCPVCGKVHQDVPHTIEEAINNDICPLCGSNLKSSDQEGYKDGIQRLKLTDEKLRKIKLEISEETTKLAEINKVKKELEDEIQDLAKIRSEIEKELFNTRNKLDVSTWDERIETIRGFIAATDKQKKEFQNKISELTNEYDKLYVNLQRTYNDIEVKFLPIFRKLAFEFTGLDLYMNLVTVTDDKRKLVKFVLRIDDSDRNSEFELSESQRFFIDIAFRMALTTFVGENRQCTMLIDTPEGSLDIAYETNAGNLFSEYIKEGFNLILTANLNSSGLIQTLAEKTGADAFELINMLRWVNLSSVQIRHQGLFESAINQIEKRLK